MKYSKKLLEKMFMTMNHARYFEEMVQTLFSKGMVHGTTHLGIGEEATAVGTILALKEQDYVLGSHRGHNQAISKGLDLNAMMAEILAKATGVCKGKGGSMHICNPDIGYLGAYGVLGPSADIACGAALKIVKKKEKDRIAAVFYGDGTSNEGAVFEAWNLAAVWRLPVLFVCVNNTYGMSTHISHAMKNTDITLRAVPFDMPAVNVNGNKVLEVYEAASKAREHILKKGGPYMLVLNTYRTSGHSKSDGNLYRSKEEIAAWKEKCPIKDFTQYLLKEKVFTQKQIDTMVAKAKKDIDDAVEYAQNSPEPSVDDVFEDVYA